MLPADLIQMLAAAQQGPFYDPRSSPFTMPETAPPQYASAPFVDQPDPTIAQRIAMALQQQEYGPISRDPKNAAMQQFLRGLAGGFSTGTLTRADTAEKNRQALNQRLAQRQAFANQQNIAESALSRSERLETIKGRVGFQRDLAKIGATKEARTPVPLSAREAALLGVPGQSSTASELVGPLANLAVNRNKPQSSAALSDARNLENANDIAEAIMAGAQPADYSQMQRGGVVAQIRGQFARAKQWGPHGFDEFKARMAWVGSKQWASTVNGRQQVQIRQSANTVLETLDKVKELNDRLSQLIPRSRATMLNSVSSGAAREWGAFGIEAQNTASQLKTIVADVVPELSNVYQAGGVPTEEAMKLARQNLDSNWSPNRIKAATDIIRQTLGYRLISIKATGAIGQNGLPVVQANDRAPDVTLAGDLMRAVADPGKKAVLDAIHAGNMALVRQLMQAHPEFENDPALTAEAARYRAAGGRR